MSSFILSILLSLLGRPSTPPPPPPSNTTPGTDGYHPPPLGFPPDRHVNGPFK